jgi:predicted nucleic acid-binding protein
MQKIIVSDTSCLILLAKINRINLLQKLFGRITITSIIANEFGNELPDFIEIEDPHNTNYQKILESIIDKGEASAISLALEKENCLLIIDDNKGRKEAQRLGLNLTGTIGILIIAKQKGLIHSISEVIDDIQNTNFRLSENLIIEAKKRCNE